MHLISFLCFKLKRIADQPTELKQQSNYIFILFRLYVNKYIHNNLKSIKILSLYLFCTYAKLKGKGE